MLRESLRQILRCTWLVAELLWSFMSFWPGRFVAANCDLSYSAYRATWLQKLCHRLLRVFNIRLQVDGLAPTSGLLVCNHLSYIDIIAIATTAPARFIAKSEIQRWPVFGLFARMAGTLFVNRSNRLDVARATEEIKTALASGDLVVLFPEGTSSSGKQVLPFKSSLLGVVAGSAYPVSAAVLDYTIRYGTAAQDVCYWGEMTLLPHLFNLLRKRQINVVLSVSPVKEAPVNRKDLARTLHSEVVRLHSTLVLSP